jgi:hypothetical protein
VPRSLIAEAAWQEVSVALKVLRHNPASRLYERPGLQLEGETETYFWTGAVPQGRSTSLQCNAERVSRLSFAHPSCRAIPVD